MFGKVGRPEDWGDTGRLGRPRGIFWDGIAFFSSAALSNVGQIEPISPVNLAILVTRNPRWCDSIRREARGGLRKVNFREGGKSRSGRFGGISVCGWE